MFTWTTCEREGTQGGSLRGYHYEAFAHKKILCEGLDGIATQLIVGGEESKETITVKIPPQLTEIRLEGNKLGTTFDESISEARGLENGAYIRQKTTNFPVIDSMFISPNSGDLKSVLLQMKAGGCNGLSGDAATDIHDKGIGHLVFVVPDESIIQNKLRDLKGTGPADMLQYRLVLKGTDYM